MLRDDQRQALRQRLSAIRDELRATLQSTTEASATVELDQTRQGRLSRMDALQGQAMAAAAQARASARLHSITGTLQRMEEADYGECLECGEPIPYERLHIDPTLRLCVGCTESIEGDRDNG